MLLLGVTYTRLGYICVNGWFSPVVCHDDEAAVVKRLYMLIGGV
jgi:hypothetical protein